MSNAVISGFIRVTWKKGDGDNRKTLIAVNDISGLYEQDSDGMPRCSIETRANGTVIPLVDSFSSVVGKIRKAVE